MILNSLIQVTQKSDHGTLRVYSWASYINVRPANQYNAPQDIHIDNKNGNLLNFPCDNY